MRFFFLVLLGFALAISVIGTPLKFEANFKRAHVVESSEGKFDFREGKLI